MMLHRLTIGTAARLIAARKLSPVELVDAYLARIARLDRVLHSYITVTEQTARTAARPQRPPYWPAAILGRCMVFPTV
jgi:aspartyl-tRNA(Asn)/glutamyl-tRNA(Gln) amidotransferase subunit A